MQNTLDLFDLEDELIVPEIEDAQLQYIPHAFTAPQADDYLRCCLEQLPWRQDTLRIAGRLIPIPRLQNWFADDGAEYSYSGISFTANPWPDYLLAMKQVIEQMTGHRFNSVLANYYRNGNDSVDWHSDDEPELGCQPVIASVSLGTPREFSLRHRFNNAIPQYKLTLQHGSLLLMSGRTQSHWQHRIAKQKAIMTPRVNLTFRAIKDIK